MLNKNLIVLASAILANQAIAGNVHRHLHREVHEKKDVVYAHTHTETKIEWVIQTVTEGQEGPASIFKAHHAHQHPSKATTTPVQVTTTSAISTPSSSSAPPPPPPAPKTTSTTPAAAPSVAASSKPIASSVPAPVQGGISAGVEVSAGLGLGIGSGAASSKVAAPSGTGSSSGSSGGKRGLAFEAVGGGKFLSAFANKPQISWAYNWNQVSDTEMPGEVEFVNMLWGADDTRASSWPGLAEKAISNGAKHFLGFNEPDHPGQALMDPQTAADKYIELLTPYSGRVSLGSPAITSDVADGKGIKWLNAWIKACNGRCQFEFCALHWYGPAQGGAQLLLNHLLDAHAACGKNVWLTEFAPVTGTSDERDSFLQEVMHQLDTNATFSFVDRYAYFMVGEGNLNLGNALSSLGSLYTSL